MSQLEHRIRLPFRDELVLAIAEDIRAPDGNADGMYKTETRRLTAPRAKAGDIMLVCEALVPTLAAVPGPHDAYADCIGYSADGAIYRRDAWGVPWPWKVQKLLAMYLPVKRFPDIGRHHRRLLEVRREPLSAITDEGARNEGIARLGWEPTREGFLRGFHAFRGLAGDADPEVTVYKWAAGEVSDV